MMELLSKLAQERDAWMELADQISAKVCEIQCFCKRDENQKVIQCERCAAIMLFEDFDVDASGENSSAPDSISEAASIPALTDPEGNRESGVAIAFSFGRGHGRLYPQWLTDAVTGVAVWIQVRECGGRVLESMEIELVAIEKCGTDSEYWFRESSKSKKQ